MHEHTTIPFPHPQLITEDLSIPNTHNRCKDWISGKQLHAAMRS